MNLLPADSGATTGFQVGFDDDNWTDVDAPEDNDLTEDEILEAVLQLEMDYCTQSSDGPEAWVLGEFDDIDCVFDDIPVQPDSVQKRPPLSSPDAASLLFADTQSKSTVPEQVEGKPSAADKHARPVREAAKAGYAQSHRGRKWPARYNHAPGRKAARAQYEKTPHGKEARRRYNQSPGGRALRRAAQARYAQSPARRKTVLIRYARVRAYEKELARSGDEALAKQKGEEAAEKRRSELDVHRGGGYDLRRR